MASSPLSVISSLARWRAIQVRSRSEHKVSEQLRIRGFTVFLPCYVEVVRWSDRMKRIEVPFFDGYMFCRFPKADAIKLLQTPGVIAIVGGLDSAAGIVDEREIESLKRIISSSLEVIRCETLRSGERVRVISGPLRDLEGTVLTDGAKSQLIITIEIVSRSVAVTIDRRSVASLPIRPIEISNWVKWKLRAQA